MKRITSLYSRIACLLLLSGMISCEKKYELDMPLAVNNEYLNFSSDAGSTHVVVWANAAWSCAFASETAWATLQNASGTGLGDFVFEYSENLGAGRRTDVVIHSGELTCTIRMYQAGKVLTPDIEWVENNIPVSADESQYTVPIKTNLGEALETIVVRIVYFDENGQPDDEQQAWITDVEIAEDTVSFTVAANTTDYPRQAHLILEVYDGVNDQTVSTTLVVSQLPVSGQLN